MLSQPPADLDTIIDFIYEAAMIPELWPDTLDTIAKLSQTDGGVLFAILPQSASVTFSAAPAGRWTASASITDRLTKFMQDDWAKSNLRVQRSLQLNHMGFMTDFDLATVEEIDNEPYYKNLRQHGLGWCAGTNMHVPTGDMLVFTWHKHFSRGPVSRESVALLDLLRPHLARAGLMASRLGLERAKAATETLGCLGLPAVVLSPRHSMLAANNLLEALMPSIVEERAMGRLHLVDKKADQLFADALSHAAHGVADKQNASKASVFSVPIQAKDEQPAMVVHVVPLRRTARDIFTSGASVVIITPVCQADVPSANVIQGLFDLTPAEARVARLIAGGETVNEIAAESKLTEGTIRNQLKSVFAKTGVSRQGDLINLLTHINPHRSKTEP